MTWKHPTNPEGKVPESICIVAMGPSKNSWIQDRICMTPQIQWDELWTLNAGVDWVHGYDLVFWMDDLKEQMRWPGTLGKLKRSTAPIITTHAYQIEGVSQPIIEYPLGHVLSEVGIQQSYLMNSVPYILAYAIAIGVKRIQMFGVDYDYPGIGIKEPNRANCEYWVGFGHARGIVIQVPDNCTLLNANMIESDGFRPFYGYLRKPTIAIESEPVETKEGEHGGVD